MKRSRFTQKQVIGVLKEHQACATATDLCRKRGISDATFSTWRSKYGFNGRFRDECLNEHLFSSLAAARRTQDRERVGREASPTAAVIDSQSIETTESGGIRGYDGGKKIKSRKRPAMVDTNGRALKLQARAANIQDRDRAGPLLRGSRPSWPFVEVAFANAGYQGPRLAAASSIRVEIVRKPEGQVGFTVHAKRWEVEGFSAWINRNGRLAKDADATIASAEAFLYAASAILLLWRLGR